MSDFIVTASGLIVPFPYADQIQIGPDVCPGKQTIIAGDVPSGWDERKGSFLSGATLVPTGDPLATFQILFELWDESNYYLYTVFYKKYFDPAMKLALPPGTSMPAALTILHPVLTQAGVQECVVTNRGLLTKDDLGLWSQTISFKRFRFAKPAPQPPIAAIPAATVTQPTAQTALERENEALANQLAAASDNPPGPR